MSRAPGGDGAGPWKGTKTVKSNPFFLREKLSGGHLPRIRAFGVVAYETLARLEAVPEAWTAINTVPLTAPAPLHVVSVRRSMSSPGRPPGHTVHQSASSGDLDDAGTTRYHAQQDLQAAEQRSCAASSAMILTNMLPLVNA